MGITGLNNILKEKLKITQNEYLGIKEVNLSKYSGSKLAIDVNIYLHHFAYNPAVKKPNSHIDGFFQIICDLLKEKIIPIMIFDGTAPSEKNDVKKARSKDRKIIEEKIQTLIGEIDSLKKQSTVSGIDFQGEIKMKEDLVNLLKKRIIQINPQMYKDLEYLFMLMGIPSLYAIGEADALCVKLYTAGIISGILSEDLDILPFGGLLIRGIKEKRISTVTEYNITEILNHLKWTHTQFVDFCILCGSDYSGKLIGIGPKTAYNLIDIYKNLETLIKEKIQPNLEKLSGEKRINLQKNLEEFQKTAFIARKLFLTSPDAEIVPEIQLGNLDQTTLIPYLIDKCRYRPTTLEKKMSLITSEY